jgi:hypothetical protein
MAGGRIGKRFFNPKLVLARPILFGSAHGQNWRRIYILNFYKKELQIVLCDEVGSGRGLKNFGKRFTQV